MKKQTRNREQTLKRIVEETLLLIQEKGIEQLNLKEIAHRCGVTRPLLNHYFKDSGKTGLMVHVFETVLTDFQSGIDAALAEQNDPSQMLEVYVRSHFKWGRDNPSRITALLLFLCKCSTDESFRKINTRSVEAGRKRIELLLHHRIKDVSRLPTVARNLQIQLTGGLVSYFTEERVSPKSRLDPERLVLEYLKDILGRP